MRSDIPEFPPKTANMSNSQQETMYGSGTITTNDDNTITRSKLRNCAITSSYVKRSAFQNCVLVKVRSASRSTGKKSHFHDATSVKRSEVNESTIREKSSAHRSTIKGSTIQGASIIKTSSVTASNVSHTKLDRTSLKNCEVEECIISRSKFDGMILKYGVWKRGQLVGKIGNKEPIAIRKNDPSLTASRDVGPSTNTLPSMPELDSKTKAPLPIHTLDLVESDDSPESEDSDDADDLPPPYKA